MYLANTVCLSDEITSKRLTTFFISILQREPPPALRPAPWTLYLNSQIANRKSHIANYHRLLPDNLQIAHRTSQIAHRKSFLPHYCLMPTANCLTHSPFHQILKNN